MFLLFRNSPVGDPQVFGFPNIWLIGDVGSNCFQSAFKSGSLNRPFKLLSNCFQIAFKSGSPNRAFKLLSNCLQIAFKLLSNCFQSKFVWRFFVGFQIAFKSSFPNRAFKLVSNCFQIAFKLISDCFQIAFKVLSKQICWAVSVVALMSP